MALPKEILNIINMELTNNCSVMIDSNTTHFARIALSLSLDVLRSSFNSGGLDYSATFLTERY